MNTSMPPRLLAAAALLLALGGASACLSAANAETGPTTPPRRGPAHRRDSGAAGRRRDARPGPRLGRQRPAEGHGAVPDRRHEGRRRLLVQDVQGLRPAGAEGELQVDPGRPDRGQRLRRRERHAGRHRRRVLPRRRHALHLGEVRHRHLRRRPRPGAPGQLAGLRPTIGDFSVAYIVAHEYGHEVQDELGLFDTNGGQLPTMAFELQADCYAGTWANSASQEGQLEDGDVQEALDAALAVGDFDTVNPSHHGTPEQREQAWKTGFDVGRPVLVQHLPGPGHHRRRVGRAAAGSRLARRPAAAGLRLWRPRQEASDEPSSEALRTWGASLVGSRRRLDRGDAGCRATRDEDRFPTPASAAGGHRWAVYRQVMRQLADGVFQLKASRPTPSTSTSPATS